MQIECELVSVVSLFRQIPAILTYWIIYCLFVFKPDSADLCWWCNYLVPLPQQNVQVYFVKGRVELEEFRLWAKNKESSVNMRWNDSGFNEVSVGHWRSTARHCQRSCSGLPCSGLHQWPSSHHQISNGAVLWYLNYSANEAGHAYIQLNPDSMNSPAIEW